MVGGVLDLIRPSAFSLPQCPGAIQDRSLWMRTLAGMKPAGCLEIPPQLRATGLDCQHLQLDKPCGFSEPEHPCL